MKYFKQWFQFLSAFFAVLSQRGKEVFTKIMKQLNIITDGKETMKNSSQGLYGNQLVFEAQNYLHEMRFPIGNYGPEHNGVDGIFGETTKACLQTFQMLTQTEPILNQVNASILLQLEQAVTAKATIRSLAINAYQKGVQPSISLESTSAEFVNALYYYAIVDEVNSKVPAAVTVAQSILETSYGKFIPSDLNTKLSSYNLFGIKGNGPAGSVICWTREENPKTKIWEPVQARFRAYHNFLESIRDHSKFFFDNISRYGAAFQAKTAAGFAKAIAKAGYATDSKYATKLISLMNYWGIT
jgi:flagellum-specific peptidoglycan hydrolase FlgJ